MGSVILFVFLGFIFPGHSVPLSPQNHVPDRKASAPSLYILSPPAKQLNSQAGLSVTCLVKSFYPSDTIVEWLQNGQPVNKSMYHTSPPNLQSDTSEQYFAYSRLTISKREWNAGDIFSCQVTQEALPFNVIQKTVKRSTGKPTMVDASLILSVGANLCD